MTRPAFRPAFYQAFRPAFNKLKSISTAFRSVYSFDGVDDRGQLAFRAINLDGDNTFEFWTPESLSVAGGACIISQNVQSAGEFRLVIGGTGALEVNFANAVTVLFTQAQGLKPNTRYGLSLIGTTYTIFENNLNGAVLRTATFAKGAVREPSAVTMLGARGNGVGSYLSFFKGQLYDIKINGTSYPMSERSQSIQLPSPSNLGAELITPAVLANPGFKGAQWSYLGDARWQLVGDGTYNELILIGGTQPGAYLLEFEVESISGGTMRCFSNATQTATMTPHKFNTVGKFRFVLSGHVSGAYQSFVRDSGSINCIIKNISLRPLWELAANELVANRDFSSATGWSVGPNQVITNSELQITNAATVSSTTRTVAIVNGKIYQVQIRVKSLTAGSVRVLLYGAGMFWVGPAITATGLYSYLAMLTEVGGSFNNVINIQGGVQGNTTCVVDDISVREITQLCNPLILANTTPDRWQEVQE